MAVAHALRGRVAAVLARQQLLRPVAAAGGAWYRATMATAPAGDRRVDVWPVADANKLTIDAPLLRDGRTPREGGRRRNASLAHFFHAGLFETAH